MDKTRQGGIDSFRLISALLIVAIHTGPLSSWSIGADALVTYTLGRVAVPFFLMVTGYFVLAPALEGKSAARWWKRTGALYLLATLLYLPVSLYAGNLPTDPLAFLRWLLLDGTFYHLWYLPAVLLGFFLVEGWWTWWGKWPALWISAGLYLLGVLGDSWFWPATQFPPLQAFYRWIFSYMTYTRNGIFYAPLFLALGAWMAGWRRRPSRKILVPALVGTLLLLLGEGWLTYNLHWQRHSSMYFLLPLVSVLLFALLLELAVEPPALARPLSQWIYLLHPLAILAVRMLGRAAGLTPLLVGNSMIYFLLTVLFSAAGSLGLIWCLSLWAARRPDK